MMPPPLPKRRVSRLVGARKTCMGGGLHRVAIPFTPDQVDELNALARANGRSFAATVAYIVENALRRRRGKH